MQYPDTAQVLNTALPASPVPNSINSITRREGGLIASKVITLSANNTTASVNAFQLTGQVLLKRIYGVITTKTTLANLTAASFDLYDSTAVVQITAAGGALSGMAIGTFFGKIGLLAANFAVANNAAGAVSEPAAVGEYFSECVLNQKTAANTYVRFTYTTTDAPIAATLTLYAEYVPIGASTLVAV